MAKINRSSHFDGMIATSMGGIRIGTPTDPIRLAVLISGSGSGMVALANFQSNHEVAFKIEIVISDKQSKGLAKAEELGLNNVFCPISANEPNETRRREHERRIEELLIKHDIEVVILSGYMRLVTAEFVNHWEGKILNIHPSLLPAHPGAHAHRDVLASGDKVSGCTIHFVDAGMDTGQIIAQAKVPVFNDDTEDSLAQRVKVEEHILYPKIIQEFCSSDNIRFNSS